MVLGCRCLQINLVSSVLVWIIQHTLSEGQISDLEKTFFSFELVTIIRVARYCGTYALLRLQFPLQISFREPKIQMIIKF